MNRYVKQQLTEKRHDCANPDNGRREDEEPFKQRREVGIIRWKIAEKSYARGLSIIFCRIPCDSTCCTSFSSFISTFPALKYWCIL